MQDTALTVGLCVGTMGKGKSAVNRLGNNRVYEKRQGENCYRQAKNPVCIPIRSANTKTGERFER